MYKSDTKKMHQLLSTKPDRLVVIHNHPQSMPPSASNINAAAKNKYKRSVIVGHNGRVFIYEAHDGFEKILPHENIFIIEKHKKLESHKFVAQYEALKSLSESYHFSIKEVL